jgi:dTDP-4-amino-4,6-dideoxygalactose transaminase
MVKGDKNTLAILGGAPAIDFSLEEARRWPVVEEDIIQAVVELLRKGELSISAETKMFEEEFARFTNTRYALATNNGTAALHSSFFALGITAGDEVICPSYTYWASIMPALVLGAIPVFADVDDVTAGVSAEHIARLITKRTKAILVVHLWGIPADMPAILKVANKHGIPVIEDASHSHGASINGQPTGSFGKIAAFSLQSSKPLPSGEGGILVTNDPDLYERCVFLGHYERISSLREGLKNYSPTPVGFKYRISPVSACIARHKLARLEATNEHIRQNGNQIETHLEKTGLFRRLTGIPGTKRVFYELQMEYVGEKKTGVSVAVIAKAMEAEGLPVRLTRYPLLHKQLMFTQPLKLWGEKGRKLYPVEKYGPFKDEDFPVSMRFQNTMLSVPVLPHADKEFVDRVLAAADKVVGALDVLKGVSLEAVSAKK